MTLFSHRLLRCASCLAVLTLSVGACSGSASTDISRPGSSAATPADEEGQNTHSSGNPREEHLSLDVDSSSLDEHLAAALRNLNEQFTTPFPNDAYLPRTAEELEAGSSTWVYDAEATQALSGEDLVFKVNDSESIQYSTQAEYNNLTLRWYCSWIEPVTDALKAVNSGKLDELRVRIEKDDPATASTPLAKAVDPSIAQYAHTLRDAANESDLSSLSTMCAPLKIQRDR